jgi:hypothetical protein
LRSFGRSSLDRLGGVARRGRTQVDAFGQTVVAQLDRRPRLARALSIAGDLLALAVTAIVFLKLNKRFYYAPIGYDEEFFVWGGWSITKGLAPYRDFIEFKPPMVFITHAFAQLLFGFKNGGYRKFFTLFPLLSFLALHAAMMARRIPRLLSLGVMLGILMLFVNPAWHDTALSDCESIGLTYFMLGLACLLWEGRFAKVTTALGGAFFTCCVLSKEPFVVVVIFTWLGLFWMRGKPQPTRESSIFYARYSLLGVGIMVALLCLYMVPTGAMKAYLVMARGYSTIYSDPNRSYCVALGIPHATTRLGTLELAWPRERSAFLNETVLGHFMPLVAAGALFAFRRSKAFLLVLLAVALGALWAPTATICQWVHYYSMSMAGLVFILVAGVDSMRQPLEQTDRSFRVAVGLAAVLMMWLHAGNELQAQWSIHYRRPPWTEPVPGVLDIIKRNTTPADRIFTSGPPVLYPEANRISAVRESNIIDEILGSYEGKTDEERLRPIYDQLVKNRPKVVVLDPENLHRKPRHYKALLMPFLKEFKYKKVAEDVYVRPGT